jgi:hypothetical protein
LDHHQNLEGQVLLLEKLWVLTHARLRVAAPGSPKEVPFIHQDV